MNNNSKNIYSVNVEKYKEIDIYRIIDLYKVYDPCLQHAIKKILCAGKRGAKDITQDINEAIYSLNRFLFMKAEDANE